MLGYSTKKKSRAVKNSDDTAHTNNPIKLLARILCLLLLLTPVIGFSAQSTNSYSLNFGWDASPSPNVTGYRLYYGTNSGTYTDSLQFGNTTTAAISGLSPGVTYYFALTTLDSGGQESTFSVELSHRQELPRAPIEIHAGPNGRYMLTAAGGPAYHTYDIEATEDLKSWTAIGSVFTDAGGTFNFTDPDAVIFTRRYYRTRDDQP